MYSLGYTLPIYRQNFKEDNYLDARKQLGKTLAEHLFPKLNAGGKADQTSSQAKKAVTNDL